MTDAAQWQDWVGREQRAEDVAGATLGRLFRATFDLDDAGHDAMGDAMGDALPPGIHWCLCPPSTPTRGLADDGHAARGGFLPPVPLPRRMWAGGRLTLHAPIPVGAAIERVSRIAKVDMKTGRSGPLCFVTVQHTIVADGRVAVEERQDIVYREAAQADVTATPPAAAAAAAPAGDLIREIDATPMMLFRYSALTFNSHRIHYDKDYVTREEGYPDLVVHGPLQATWLLQAAGDMLGATPQTFEFRGLNALFPGPCTIRGTRDGDSAAVWIENADGLRTTQATAGL